MPGKQTHVPNYGNLGHSRKWTAETPQNDRAEKANSIWVSGLLFKTQLEDPTRHQRVNILNLAKLTALESIVNRCSGRPQVKQGVLVRKHNNHDSILLLKNAINNLAIWGREGREEGGVQHTHFCANHMFSLERRIKVVFRNLCCAAIFSVLV